MTREDLIAQLQWNDSTPNSTTDIATGLEHSTRWRSSGLRFAVVVVGLPDKYTDKELAQLLQFSQEHARVYGGSSPIVPI